jgi:hypothetical protein
MGKSICLFDRKFFFESNDNLTNIEIILTLTVLFLSTNNVRANVT